MDLGTVTAFWNLSKLVPGATVVDGSYEDAAIIRVVSVNIKYEVLVLLLYPDIPHSDITIKLNTKKNNATQEVIQFPLPPLPYSIIKYRKWFSTNLQF